MRNRFAVWAALALIGSLVGCGGGASNSGGGGGGNPTLTSLAVTPAAPPSISFGGTQQFKATGNYSDGSSKDLTAAATWSSSDSTIATVSATGLATGVKAGVVTITASTGGVSGSTTVAVAAGLTAIAITPPAPGVNVGAGLQLTATGTYQDGSVKDITSSVIWSSSSNTVATVSSQGLASGLKGGVTTITATQGAMSGSTVLTVTALLQSITISPSNITATVGGAAVAATATGHYNDNTTKDLTLSVVWASADSTIASVSSTGSVSAVKGGTTSITATQGGFTGTATVTAQAVLSSVTVSPLNPSIAKGATQQFTAAANYNDGTTTDITVTANWTTSDAAVADFVAGTPGLVLGIGAGTANIKASFGGQFGQTGITVNLVLQSIAVTPANTTLLVGSSLQYTATATYADGSTKIITATATWSSSDPAVASIASGGLATALKGGSTTISATDGASGISGSTLLTVNPILTSIAVTPTGPTIGVGKTQQFTATGTFNDGSTLDVTSLASWTSSNTSVATVNTTGKAIGVAAGTTTISASYASNSLLVTGSTALNVSSGAPGSLNGDYAFTMSSADLRGNQLFAGSFHATAPDANGNGTIDSGVEDSNTAAGVTQNVSLTGTYSISPDGRGSIIFAANTIHPAGLTLRFVLAGSGTLGRMIEFDGNGTLKGAFEQQATGAAVASGNFVFHLGGEDSGSNPEGQVGFLVADGAGNITGGNLDDNDFGVVSSPALPITATTYSVGLKGRGTVTIATSLGPANYVFYVVDSSHLNLMQVDAAPAAALAGVAELQTSQTYSISTLNGGYAFLLDQPVAFSVDTLTDRSEFNKIGRWNFDGLGGLTGIQDEDNNESKNPLTGITGAYSVSLSGINGRGTLTESTTLGARSYVFYMVSPGKMLVLETLLGSAGGSKNAPVGAAELQTGTPFGLNTLSGSFAMTGSELTEEYEEDLMQLNFDGAGNATGINVSSSFGVLSSQLFSGSYASNFDTVTGRGVITLPAPVGAASYVFYVVSPQKALVLGVSPDLDGDLNQQ